MSALRSNMILRLRKHAVVQVFGATLAEEIVLNRQDSAVLKDELGYQEIDGETSYDPLGPFIFNTACPDRCEALLANPTLMKVIRWRIDWRSGSHDVCRH